jgi:hypothetical protein
MGRVDGRQTWYFLTNLCRLLPHPFLRTRQENNARQVGRRNTAPVCRVFKASLQAIEVKSNSCFPFFFACALTCDIQNLPADMLARVAEIVHYMQKRQYQKANDSYLRLSIGNAPWPIGVTMVGYVSCFQVNMESNTQYLL